MTARCELSDLLVEQCGCRLHAPAAVQSLTPPGTSVGPLFTAAYPGRCTGCDQRFDQGDQIAADGYGGWVCAGCAQ